jgi:hypothetical protein
MINQEFCCEPLCLLIEDPECPLKYIPFTREFVLTAPKHYLKKNEVSLCFVISYCPRCGKAFPQELSEQWYDTLEQELGITGFIDAQKRKNLPQEFQTDEWWKKRGL